MNLNVISKTVLEQAYLEIYEFLGKEPQLASFDFVDNELLHIEFFISSCDTFKLIWEYSEQGRLKVSKSHLNVIKDKTTPINIQENFILVVNHLVRLHHV